MTKEQITTIILAIVVAVVSALSKSIFDKLFAEYKPDKKKIISQFKFLILFIFRYIIPIIGLINLAVKSEKVDKTFVISFSVLLFILVLNIFIDILFNYYDNSLDKERLLHKQTYNVVKDLEIKEKENHESFKHIIALIEKQANLSESIIDYLKNKNNS